jgi:hypothetical protein
MRGSLMRLFTPEQHRKVLAAAACNVLAAAGYNWLLPEGSAVFVSRQNVKYWRTLFADNGGNMAKTDRELKKDRVLQAPAPVHQGVPPDHGEFDPERAYECILHIPDQHAPYQHKDTIPFLVAVRDAFRPDLIINAGDETDKHAMSFHDSDPNLDSAGAELERAKVFLAELAQEFPQQLLCDSNHGSMHYRKAKAHGIPVQYLKTYRDILFPTGGGDGWVWAESWRVKTPMGDVLFKHQASGSVLVDAAHNQCNLMVGHNHGNYSVEYSASSACLYWGAYGGCLIDKDSLAFAYGKHTLRKPVLGCSVILRGRPMLIPMVLNEEGRWVGGL